MSRRWGRGREGSKTGWGLGRGGGVAVTAPAPSSPRRRNFPPEYRPSRRWDVSCRRGASRGRGRQARRSARRRGRQRPGADRRGTVRRLLPIQRRRASPPPTARRRCWGDHGHQGVGAQPGECRSLTSGAGPPHGGGILGTQVLKKEVLVNSALQCACMIHTEE